MLCSDMLTMIPLTAEEKIIQNMLSAVLGDYPGRLTAGLVLKIDAFCVERFVGMLR